MEPPQKLKKIKDYEPEEMISIIENMFFSRLQNIEEKIEKISSKYILLEKKIDMLISSIQGNSVSSSAVDDSEKSTRYSEADYPDGSWLGDPDNPEFRLRCPITPNDLEYINNHCASAEKMSLMLLDHLFPREVQACSNISGLGKYKKKQLDPYKIQAIMYHVMYKFGITTNDWNRIKLNIDSKCRTAFRRKAKGLPVNIRGKKGRPFYTITRETDDSNGCGLSPISKTLNPEGGDIFNPSDEPRSDEEHSFTEALPTQIENISTFTFPISKNTEITDIEEQRIEVITATKEQFEMLSQNPSIEILNASELTS